MSTPVTFSAGQPVTAAQLNTLGAAVATYTPALTAATTSPTLGSGSAVTGQYGQLNWLAAVWFDITFGTSGTAAGSGEYRVSLPVNIEPGAATGMVLGSGTIWDNDVSSLRLVTFEMVSGQPGVVKIAVEADTSATSSAPWTWAASDRITGQVLYPADW